ncbi:MAG: DUF952 domain-containing protein [Pseudomonadota bacterium]
MKRSDTTRIYKILNEGDWSVAEALGQTKTDLDEGDGYVHLSARNQVEETLRLYYSGQRAARLLEYIAEDFGEAMQWEASRGGQLFPHLYGPLKIADAQRIWLLETGETGVPELPEDIDA